MWHDFGNGAGNWTSDDIVTLWNDSVAIMLSELMAAFYERFDFIRNTNESPLKAIYWWCNDGTKKALPSADDLRGMFFSDPHFQQNIEQCNSVSLTLNPNYRYGDLPRYGTLYATASVPSLSGRKAWTNADLWRSLKELISAYHYVSWNGFRFGGARGLRYSEGYDWSEVRNEFIASTPIPALGPPNRFWMPSNPIVQYLHINNIGYGQYGHSVSTYYNDKKYCYQYATTASASPYPDYPIAGETVETTPDNIPCEVQAKGFVGRYEGGVSYAPRIDHISITTNGYTLSSDMSEGEYPSIPLSVLRSKSWSAEYSVWTPQEEWLDPPYILTGYGFGENRGVGIWIARSLIRIKTDISSALTYG